VFANSLFANTAPDPLAPRTNTTHTNEQAFANSVRERRTLAGLAAATAAAAASEAPI